MSVVAISGLVIALRMLFGPFDGPLRVRIPLNPEGWFGLAVTILLATKDGKTEHGEKPQWRQHGWLNAAAILVLVGFTTIAFWRTLQFYFLSDDFILVKIANTSHFAMRPMFTTAGGDGFFRPIGNISLMLSSTYAGVNPISWHATALALHIANVVLVFILAIRLCSSRLAAFFAAALFAIHGTRPEAVAWIAGRFDLVATFFVLAGLLFFGCSQRETASISNFCTLASLVCMVLAILSKESAYIFPLVLVLFLVAKRDESRNRIGVLIPFFVTAVALFASRWWLFSGIGGYRDALTGKAQALTFGASTVKALGLLLWTALYFPINWSVEPNAGMAALMVAYIGALVWLTMTRPNRRLMGFSFGFVIVSALPPLHLLGIGAGLANSRLLYLPSVGFCLMLAVAADGLNCRVRWIIPAVMLAFNFAALQHNLDSWEYASKKAKATSAAARTCISPGAGEIVVSGIPSSLRGVPVFANGLLEALELQRNGAPLIMTVSGANHPSGSHSLVWNRMTETAECVCPGNHVGYYDRAGSPGGRFGQWHRALSSSGSTTTRARAYSPRCSFTPR